MGWMQKLSRLCFAGIAVCGALFLAGCQGLQSPPATVASQPFTVTVAMSGGGSGTVVSTPTGINCSTACSATFQPGTQVTLAATAETGFQFAGWSGACSGTGSCIINSNNGAKVTATFSASLQSINHIIFMMQENRGFLHYFGALKSYWAAHGFPDQQFDGWTQYNTAGAPPESSIGCDPNLSNPFPPNDCVIGPNSPQVQSFHMISQCIENPSPSWNEAHVDWNVKDPVSPTPTLDGFIHSAAHDARHDNPPLSDINGMRAMSYYTDADLPYYYFMASNFATSDRWFSPAMTRTQPNRMYLMAATSAGYAYPLKPTDPQLTNKTIFELLQDNNISWRVYVTDDQDQPIEDGAELGEYVFANSHHANFVSATQFISDLNRGNLPSVVEIDPGFAKGLDEHAGENDKVPSGRIQAGAQYVSTLINALMQSQYWKDSVFILTWDENGGFYDHVAPQQTVSPEGMPPSDLQPGDVCTNPAHTGPNCDFVFTGYRVPLIVISPFSKKNYVSHTVADYTAILKLIETRFGLGSLTSRDAAQMDMTGFFDFTNSPWKTPPTPPTQPTSAPCYLDHRP
jgi:phospholipase C